MGRFICKIHVQPSHFPDGISFRLKINEKFKHANATAILCFHCDAIKHEIANQSIPRKSRIWEMKEAKIQKASPRIRSVR